MNCYRQYSTFQLVQRYDRACSCSYYIFHTVLHSFTQKIKHEIVLNKRIINLLNRYYPILTRKPVAATCQRQNILIKSGMCASPVLCVDGNLQHQISFTYLIFYFITVYTFFSSRKVNLYFYTRHEYIMTLICFKNKVCSLFHSNVKQLQMFLYIVLVFFFFFV